MVIGTSAIIDTEIDGAVGKTNFRRDPIQHRNGIIHKNMPELMKNGELFQMTDLTPIQKEIVTALEQMKEKSLITEANLAKKVRENAKKSAVSLVKNLFQF